MVLYRAVSMDELHDLNTVGLLRPGESSCEGKHLATTLEDARAWGRLLYPAEPFAVLEIEVDDALVRPMTYWDRLDGIGPAYFATMAELAGANVLKVHE